MVFQPKVLSTNRALYLRMYNGIALCGKAGTGKDTVCNLLRMQDPLFHRVGFADGVKQVAKDITGVDFFKDEVKEQAKNRAFLQFLGTDLMREKWDQEFWVNYAMNKCSELREQGFIPVITDARFPNEVHAAEEQDFLIVRLEAKPSTLEKRGRPMTDHASETALDTYPFRHVIHTDNLSPSEVMTEVLKVFDAVTHQV